MREYGIGVGYRYPHDFDGADVDQRYLPDELADRRYYLPTDHGYEGTIATRMAARADAREQAREAGGPRRLPAEDRGPAVDPMRVAGTVMKTREESRRKLSDTEKRDAADEQPRSTGGGH
jgi:hypothetical protein